MQNTISYLPPLLKDKNIILGVCGSVAIYKALEVIRNLQKLGANVRVIMTKGAHEFINPLLFEAISHHKVLTQESQSWGEIPLNHIEIATWGDVFLIAPCSANTLNKIAQGIADNVLLDSFLAFDKIKIIAPSANTKMLENSATLESLKILKQRNITIINTQRKELACKIIGNGALAEPLEITFKLLKEVLKEPFWEHCEVCVSGGGSVEAIDAVRFISNYSSGQMGASLALCAYFLGAKTCFISSQMPFLLPLDIEIKNVKSAQDYSNAIAKWQNNATKDSYLFMSAAISDYIPENKAQEKLKKSDIGEEWNLKLKENIDILATIAKKQKTIGFKLESQNVTNSADSAKKALKAKNLNAICLNTISTTHNPLESKENQITWIQENFSKNLGFSDKISLSFKILAEAKNL